MKKHTGFTIVELLVVIVVIGVLAGISVVAYNGIQDKAVRSQVVASATQAGKKARLYAVENDTAPTSLTDLGLQNTSGITYGLTQSDGWFCVTARSNKDAKIIAGEGSNGKCATLNAAYYNNGTLAGTPALTRTEGNIDNIWSTGSPAPGINVDNFSASWNGTITAPTTDTYTISMYVDDRIRLYLNDTLVADHWASTCCTWRTATYSFVGGQPVPIRVEMAEGGGGAAVRLHWSYTGQASTAIPPSAFGV